MVAHTPQKIQGRAGQERVDKLAWRSAIARLEGAYSENTLRGYRSDFAAFEAWCGKKHRRCLPASSRTIASFIEDEIVAFAPATLARRLAAIRKVHCLLRLGNPLDDEEVSIALRRARRSKPRRQKQARGLTRNIRDKLISACPEDTLIGLRNRAIIAVGYDTLCRRSELIALRSEDLNPLSDGAMSILIRRSKSDQFGDGRYGYLSSKTTTYLKAWLDAASLNEGWLFRRVLGKSIGEHPLHPFTISKILRATAHAAGLKHDVVKAISAHSLRIGAAQDLMTEGAGLLRIMRAGGWKSANTISRYVEHAELELFGRSSASTLDWLAALKTR
jgi:integrase/recombinase XerD